MMLFHLECLMDKVQQRICASTGDNQDRSTMFHRHTLKIGSEKGVGNRYFIVGRWVRGKITVMQPARTNGDGGTPVNAIISCGHQFQATSAKVHHPYLRRVTRFLVDFVCCAKEGECGFGISADQLHCKFSLALYFLDRS